MKFQQWETDKIIKYFQSLVDSERQYATAIKKGNCLGVIKGAYSERGSGFGALIDGIDEYEK